MVNIKKAVRQARDKLQIERTNRKGDDLRLRTTMEDYTREQTEAIELWVDNNIKYIRFNLTYLGRFATEDLSKTTIEVLNERLKKIESLFNKNKTPIPQKYLDIPFDPSPLIHLRQSMLSLMAEVVLLKKLVESLSKKFFGLKD